MRAQILYEKFHLSIMKVFRIYCTKRSYYQNKKMMRQNGIKLIPLEKAQKREVKKLWGKKGIFNYDTHKLVYWGKAY